MSVVKSFDDKSVCEDVLPNAVFEASQYVDTDIAASVRKYLNGKIYSGANTPELKEVFKSGETHADVLKFDFDHDVDQFEAHGYNGLKAGLVKARLNSIYGKENSPEA